MNGKKHSINLAALGLEPVLQFLVVGLCSWVCGLGPSFAQPPGQQSKETTKTVRIAAAQAAARSVDFHFTPEQALAAVDTNLSQLERIVDRAGLAKCDALVLPEDTLGLLNWLGANETLAKDFLPKALARLLAKLGPAAARHRIYLVVCSDVAEKDGIYNTAFLLGRDGKEIGRYHKVCPTWSEAGLRKRGNSFPVFSTPDLGTVGLLICYDLVMPETARCLALLGADIIFFPTMGGAAIGDDDIGRQALRVRAAENFTWLVVAQRGDGAMIISPQGKIIATAKGPDDEGDPTKAFWKDSQSVWFDDVVVARRYIGPMTSTGAGKETGLESLEPSQ